MSRVLFVFPLLFCIFSTSELFSSPPSGVPLRQAEFGRNSLTRGNGLSLPSGFGMQQSYSMSFLSGNLGSQSSGVYLNTLSYTFSFPLILSLDVGSYNLFSTSMPTQFTPTEGTNSPSFIFPRVGLEYRPSKNFALSLQFFNMNDAQKAYGFGRRLHR